MVTSKIQKGKEGASRRNYRKMSLLFQTVLCVGFTFFIISMYFFYNKFLKKERRNVILNSGKEDIEINIFTV